MIQFISTTGVFTKGNSFCNVGKAPYASMYFPDANHAITGNVRISSSAGVGATSNIYVIGTPLLNSLKFSDPTGITPQMTMVLYTNGGAPEKNALQKLIMEAPQGNDGTRFWGGRTEWNINDTTSITQYAANTNYVWTLSVTKLPWQYVSAGTNVGPVSVTFCY